MQKEEQVRLLKGLINYLETGTNVDAGGIMQTPTDTYTSEERFSEEWNKFFRDYPQIVGMTETWLNQELFSLVKILVFPY